MGSCMSCKAGKEAHEYTTSPAAYPTQRTCYYYSMENGPFSSTSQGENKGLAKRSTPYTRGQATLFGFKRRSASAVPTPVTNTSTPMLDNAGSLAGSKAASQESLNSISPIPSGRSTPRLSRPKKDADGNLIRTNRFGFRGPAVASITNKVSDSNYNSNPPVMSSHHASSHHNQENQSVLRVEKPRAKGGGKIVTPVTPGMKHSAHSITSSGDSGKTKQQLSLIPQPEHHEHGKASRFTLQTSLLPRPQYPIRLTSVDSEKTTKGAKTAANNSTRKVSYHVSGGEESSSKEGSLNGDSGIGSHQSGAACYGETDTLQGIEQLDSSPTFGLRRNRKPRALEMVVNGQYFDVRDLKDEDSSAADDPNVITEISLISIPSSKPTNGTIKTVQNTGIVQQRSMQYQRQIANDNKRQGSSFTASSDEFRDDGLVGEGEEKALRDRSHSEKTESIKDHITPCSIEDQEDWGHGEAMAEEYSSSSEDGHGVRCGSSPESMNLNAATTVTVPEPAQQPRPVMLTIEDPLFAAIAAAACPTMIEDETSPVDSLFSSSTATSTASEILEKDQPVSNPLPKDDNKSMQDHDKGNAEGSAHRSANMLSPDSPGTPTNASTSLSLSVSEGRDFLIDDEIADQPGLTFDDGANTTARGHIESGDMATSSGGCTSQLLSMTENTATLIDSTSKPVPKQRVSASFDGSPVRTRRISRTGSIDTLSPCESIASDDLMLDYERSEGSLFDCTAESRLDNSSGVIYQREEATLMSELESKSDSVLRELSSLLGAHAKEKGLVSGRPAARVLRSRTGSTPDSPRSLDPKARVAGSPLRPPRQVTPGSETEDSSLRLDRGTYQYMYQDIVNIKTMLLKLKRVLQENEENSLMRAETLNPFDGTLKNGLFYTLANSEVMAAVNTEDGSESGVGHSPQEEVADLRRQVVFLQQQLDEKERTIQLLQLQMTKYTNSDATSNAAGKESCNAATQTERVRPVSAGPSLLQSLPSENNMGPLVSFRIGKSFGFD
ncbi:uncharacterized threonine-rich GPI-anchored glycoprotein PJ4664.02 isoform X4 [Cryptotermes secundus]|uniref:uncharacterized threonine-rich GPI-anchored glycoprotein PJ4664.02 isoform X4 n=1 Tax=Cryptotermes secundus TaxID=105785 RepID=UPI000CD7B321|nr:uncharacterized threonine-rich GPI-anchored glycoprotein PJ4664.02 isoform X4 [Cryptotermes secundus]